MFSHYHLLHRRWFRLRLPNHAIFTAQRLLLGVGLLLAMALTLFFVKSQSINLQQHYQFVRDLREIEALDGAIKTDILKARFAIDAHYGYLVRHSEQLRLQQRQLRRELPLRLRSDGSTLPEQFRQIEVILARQSTLVEQFKSQNTILQNSLRYFPKVAQSTLQQFENTGVDATLTEQLHRLLEAVLIYNVNAQEYLKPAVQSHLRTLQTLTDKQPVSIQAEVEPVLIHARIILQLGSDVQQIINEIIRLPVKPPLNRFIGSYEAMQTHIAQEASFYRSGLYATCLGLLGLVIALYRIRDRAQLLTIANANLEQVVDQRTEDLKQTLNELQQSQVQLIQAEKMAGLGQLVAGIAHEINNPISFIYSNIAPAMRYVADTMGVIERYQAAYPDPDPTIAEYLTAIDWEFTQTDLPQTLTSMRTGADRIREIVLSLRNFSRLDEADKKAANLNEGIASTLLILQHRLKAQTDRCAIAVVQDLGPLPKILCYPGQINQVFMNLLANAIDALEAAIAQDPQLQPAITIRTAMISPRVSPLIRVEVTDNGIGMTPETQQKLFNPFFTTKPVGKGTGLGTSISYQIVVDRHGGSIQCDSTLGQGTRFILEFPITSATATIIP
jgi:signal transduction histidine kinase